MCGTPSGGRDEDWLLASLIPAAIKCSDQDMRMYFLGKGPRGQSMEGTHLTHTAHVLNKSVTVPLW